ncbi:hypothetical protein LGR54_10285 [Ancylobacter sp. Lp-2]|uniref:hypothetical protein n=1 Tax=Ancylobacter sp. Lp-2 TaxID=2881339 RepID=UPI001E36145D|nr:hypothetical protein [Ancylobacter sp. Lp-2]MCB4768992.1 hypothetical protein [Ancylobacter sp. Lp-2]
MNRVFVVTALIASIGMAGITAASASGRSKEERKAWWDTFHQVTKSPQGTAQPAQAPASKAPKAAKPAQ